MTDGFQPNAVLRRQMKERGYTREGLAMAVNKEAERLTGLPGSCSERLVGRWLKGEVAWPQEKSRLPLEAVFGCPAEALGFRSPAGGTSRVTVRSPTHTPQEPPVHRRRFIIGISGSILRLPTLPAAGRLGMSDVARIQAVGAQLHTIDDSHGAGDLAQVAGRYIEYVEAAARRCSYGSGVQDRLYAALASLATSAGWFAFDVSDQERARRYWDAALRYALLAGDGILQARVWSSMSNQACILGHGGEAVAIARAALDQTRGRRDGKLSALLHTRVAQGHAAQGESGWCGRSLLRAEQAMDREGRGEPQRWLGFFNPGEVAGTKALCYMDLHQYDRAVTAAQDAARIVGRTPLRRNQLACEVRLGRALAAAGELEGAMAAGTRALSLLPEVRSPRIAVRLERLRDELLHRGAQGAAEFSDQYEAVALCP